MVRENEVLWPTGEAYDAEVTNLVVLEGVADGGEVTTQSPMPLVRRY